jgi:hypothetical protein
LTAALDVLADEIVIAAIPAAFCPALNGFRNTFETGDDFGVRVGIGSDIDLTAVLIHQRLFAQAPITERFHTVVGFLFVRLKLRRGDGAALGFSGVHLDERFDGVKRRDR